MVGEYKKISFLGVNKEPLDDQAQDGLCDDIVNLRPRGDEKEPYWEPVADVEVLTNESGLAFLWDTNIKSAYWQIIRSKSKHVNRDIILDNIDVIPEDIKRLLILTQDAGGSAYLYLLDPSDWSVVATKMLNGSGDYSMSATRVGDVTIVSTNLDGEGQELFVLKNDVFESNILPELPQAELRFMTKAFSTEDIASGNTHGFAVPIDPSKREYSPRYVMYRVVYELFDGTKVRHSDPSFCVLPEFQDATYYNGAPIFTGYYLPVAIMKGYQDVPERISFWKDYIRAVSIYMTVPSEKPETALGDGVYYLAHSWTDIENIPLNPSTEFFPLNTESEWVKIVEVNGDIFVTRETLNIDNFTNHGISANIIDSYNRRVLLGGSVTNFVLPKNKSVRGIPNYMNIGVNEELSTGSGSSGNSVYINLEIESSYTIGEITLQESGNITQHLNFLDQAPAIINFRYLPELNDFDYSNCYALFKVDVLKDGSDYESISIKWTPFYDFSQSGVTVESSSVDIKTYECWDEVLIETDKGIFRRVSVSEIDAYNDVIKLPVYLSYPDNRVTQLRTIIKNGLNYELVQDVRLRPSNRLNIGYKEDVNIPKSFLLSEIVGGPGTINNEVMKHSVITHDTYTVGTNVVGELPPNVEVNNYNLSESSKVRASMVNNPFVFDAGATYDVGGRYNSAVMGFAVNAIETSQGQFGQYPLYILTNAGIYSLEQTGDPEVAFGRLVPVTPSHGITSTEAFTNAERIILFANESGIYTIFGNEINRISDQIFSDDYYNSDYAKGVILAFNKKREEVWVTNPSYEYSIVYNVEYRRWYKVMRSYSGFFYDYPTLFGISAGKRDIKDFNEEQEGNVSYTLMTRPMGFGNHYFRKRFRRSVLRGIFKQLPNKTLTVKLTGYINGSDSVYTLMNGTYTKESINDILLGTPYGSMNSFILEISGEADQGTKIFQLEANYENRYTHRVRR